MKNIVGIRFRKPGKVYFFDPGYIRLNPKDKVIVETSLGEDIGEVVISKRELPEEKVPKDLKRIIRLASYKDIKRQEDNKQKEKKAMEVCKEQIKKHKLEMNLVDVEYKFDGSKIIFYFTADGRVDFRELVKDLAAIYKTRIELRQIGVRDEVRRMGGNGVCGRELCCCSFLNNFDAVSIKMAKEQNMSLNPSKISGVCGRLMCCLKYEQEAYEEKLGRLPKVGSIVETVDGEGTVDSVEILKENIRVKFKDEDEILEKAVKKGKDTDLAYVEDVLPEKMKYNLEYISKFSFWYDIKICVNTVIGSCTLNSIWDMISP